MKVKKLISRRMKKILPPLSIAGGFDTCFEHDGCLRLFVLGECQGSCRLAWYAALRRSSVWTTVVLTCGAVRARMPSVHQNWVAPETEVFLGRSRSCYPFRRSACQVDFPIYLHVRQPDPFVETWRSQSDIEKHRNSAHSKKFLSLVGKTFAPGYPVIKFYQDIEK